MPFTLVLHINNSDPVVGEVDELPAPSDHLIKLNNPRRLDGKDLPYLGENIATAFWPVEKINFIELLPVDSEDNIIGFFRE